MNLIFKKVKKKTMSSNSSKELEYNLSGFFPLYDMLSSQIQNFQNYDKPLSDIEIDELKKKIISLDKTGSDMIYVWIRVHAMRNMECKLLDIPYGGINLGAQSPDNNQTTDVKFDIRNFPPILSRMLLHFCNLHIRKTMEEAERLNRGK